MIAAALIIIASLFFTGIIVRVKSRLSGRKGPGMFQPLRDILRNLRKGSVYSETTSFVFQLAPSVSMATLLVAMACVPLGSTPGLISFRYDFVFFAYTLATGKFLMVIAALDTGSSFEGMGASREALFSLLVEPAFFTIMGSFALFTGHGSFSEIFSALHGMEGRSPGVSITLSALAAMTVMFVGMVENSRMPVDDPKTHLELTMIHEVMILDNSGFDLGIIMYGSCLRFAVYGALAANMFIFPGTGDAASAGIFLLTQVLYALFIGILESVIARFRMRQNPQFIYTITAVTLLIFLATVLLAGYR